MKGYTCVKCGSQNIVLKSREMEFKLQNPGALTVIQECSECQECGERYFDSTQMQELSRKLDEERIKVRS